MSWGLQDPAEQDHLGQAEGDDGHHEGEQGPHRQALVVQGLAPAAGCRRRWSTAGTPRATATRTAKGLPAPAYRANKSCGAQPWMTAPSADADEQVGPDPAQDRAGPPRRPSGSGRPRSGRAAGSMTCPRSRVSKTNGSTQRSSVQPAEDEPGDDGDEQARRRCTARSGRSRTCPAAGAIAISLTIGLAMRKLIVTPSGTPAATNPMNAGTALHEQNGVTTPSPAASDVADALAPAAEQGAGALDAHERAQHRDGEDDPGEQQDDLDGVVEEEVDPRAEPRVEVESRDVPDEPVPQRPVDGIRADPEEGGGGEQRPEPVGRVRPVLAPVRRALIVHSPAGRPRSRASAPARERVVDPPATAGGGHEPVVAQHLEVVAEQVRRRCPGRLGGCRRTGCPRPRAG